MLSKAKAAEKSPRVIASKDSNATEKSTILRKLRLKRKKRLADGAS